MSSPERDEVELPLCRHLESLGWKWTTDEGTDPAQTNRSEFSEVVLKSDFTDALKTLNLLDDGRQWVDDARVNQVLRELIVHPGHGLLEKNQAVTKHLLSGVTVDGLAKEHQGKGTTLRLVDWDHPERNIFRVINQFKIKLASGKTSEHIYPDVILFVNGLPLVVIECKAPTTNHDKLPDALDQLARYSNQRAFTDFDEGHEPLFYTNQILIATDGGKSLYGPLGLEGTFWNEWKETFPRSREEVEKRLGKQKLNSLEVLTEGLLSPENLLKVLRSYVIFSSEKGALRKVLPRYQQFRAVENAMTRLLTGKKRLEDPDRQDRRGGIIWHTQGSGKSLTMTFLVRRLRLIPELRKFKVVIVTDRRDLQKQLMEALDSSGQNIYTPETIVKLRARLAVDGPEIVFAMIQKYQSSIWDAEEVAESTVKDSYLDSMSLNSSDSILVMVDEGHRGQAGEFHLNLLQALPNSARIAFTGTPIIMGKKKKTTEIFGDFIDKYRLKEAEADGAIVPILYEGRTVKGIVKDEKALDELFTAFFHGAENQTDLAQYAMQKFGNKGDILESQELVKAKALDMLRHYVINVLPNGLKAQVVAYSRRACVRYQQAFLEAKKTIQQERDTKYRGLFDFTSEGIIDQPEVFQSAWYAHQYRDIFDAMEFAAVMSGNHNDPKEYETWTDPTATDTRIAQFKKPYIHSDPTKASPLGFLIVKNMLLTGFDAPIEGVLYLDRPLKEAELLQTIARVNRTYPGKEFGLVVDYFGLSARLHDALKAYSQEDIYGAMTKILDKLKLLEEQHAEVVGFFQTRGLHGLEDVKACVNYFREESDNLQALAEFWTMAQNFFSTLDLIMPRPEAKPFLADAKQVGEILAEVRQIFQKDRPVIDPSTGARIRKLLDDHLLSKGIDIKIPPKRITDKGFQDHINGTRDPKSKAQDMEHALRHFLQLMDKTNPAGAKAFAQRLEEILKKYSEDWQKQLDLMNQLYEDATEQAREKSLGLSPAEIPLFNLFERAKPKGTEADWVDFIHHLGVLIKQKTKIPNLWSSAQNLKDLEGEIYEQFVEYEYFHFAERERMAREILDAVKSNHTLWQN